MDVVVVWVRRLEKRTNGQFVPVSCFSVSRVRKVRAEQETAACHSPLVPWRVGLGPRERDSLGRQMKGARDLD